MACEATVAAVVVLMAVMACVMGLPTWDRVEALRSPVAVVAMVVVATAATVVMVAVAVDAHAVAASGEKGHVRMTAGVTACVTACLVAMAAPGIAMATTSATVRRAFSPEAVVAVTPYGESWQGWDTVPRPRRSELATVEFHVDDGTPTGRDVSATAGGLGYAAVVVDGGATPHEVEVTGGRALAVPAGMVTGTGER